ncbi:MAG: hypothetical protein L0Y72_18610 [Gemmataceae bacterium]|nr:hypothetical protein [Gemmataceae bacterium]MCI0741060.1 hypothetical protein [Gemmataceae bacterium]
MTFEDARYADDEARNAMTFEEEVSLEVGVCLRCGREFASSDLSCPNESCKAYYYNQKAEIGGAEEGIFDE